MFRNNNVGQLCYYHVSMKSGPGNKRKFVLHDVLFVLHSPFFPRHLLGMDCQVVRLP